MENHQQPTTNNQQRTLYLIDGSGFIFRAYHALPPLTDPKGTPVGAVYGFTSMVMKLMEGRHPEYIAVIFDAARKTFRNELYAEYKANRPPAPDDLIPQFPLVRDATRALNLPAIEQEGIEADDIIACYAMEARKRGIEVVIVSSDKDLMQLVGEGVSMFDAMKQKTIGEAEVREKFGVGPDKVRDVLALIGDSSDNVPGVPGIGPKTAAELIGQYGDLETLLSRAGEIKQPKRRETIEQNADKARLSKELVTLKCDAPLPLPIEALAAKEPDVEKLVAFAEAHGFKSLAGRLRGKIGGSGIQGIGGSGGQGIRKENASSFPNAPIPRPPESHYHLVRDEASLAAWIARARDKGHVAFDTETTGLDPLRAELVGFSLCVEPGEACYVPLGHKALGIREEALEKERDLFSPMPNPPSLMPNQIPLARAIALIKPLLEDESVLKIGHNIKYDLMMMKRYGIETNPLEDTMLLSYCLHAGEHGQGMDELAERYLNHKTISFDEVTGTGKNRVTFDRVELEKACAYAAEDADVTLRLWQVFKPQVAQERMLTLYETVERPLIPVLSRMEAAGIKVDAARLSALSKDFAARMGEFEREIHKLAGREFNVASPKQLGEVLFDEMKLEGGRKSGKTGAYSTDNEVLEELAAGGNDIAAKVIEWRQLAKLKGTYTDALAAQINPETGRVHTNYAMAIASTGRLSSTDPNLQNIPIRTVEGRKIREAFIAGEGCRLISADYSQIELRLLAHMADIATLKSAFKNGDDIHAITASQMFGVKVDEVNADLRRSAKTINFGIIYGISAHGLATRLGIGRQEAADYIGRYFAQYPGIRDYMEATKEFARGHGYVATLFGRRCHLPGILDKNPARRQFFERAAINAPLQGTAADIIKRAMIVIDRGIGDSGDRGIREAREERNSFPDSLNPRSPSPPLRMLLQVHDELVFEAKENAVDAALPLIKRHMEQAAQLSVPLTVETGVGHHWGEAH